MYLSCGRPAALGASRAARKSCVVLAAAGARRPPSTTGFNQAPSNSGRQKPPGQHRQTGGGGGGGGSSGSTWQDVDTTPVWRVFGIVVPADDDPGKDEYVQVHPALLAAVSRKVGVRGAQLLPAEAVRVVRKSFDARSKRGRGQSEVRTWAYCVDVDSAALKEAGVRRLEERPGSFERQQQQDAPPASQHSSGTGHSSSSGGGASAEPVVVVGSGPAGLWAALQLAEAGVKVILLDRGQPVEVRGRDIGALFVRQQVNPESNLCYGEGGAGTWSDGKLTTRIGRNSDPVRQVLDTLYRFGAPDSVLVSGKPHLGTDRLVRILKAFRQHLIELGCEVRFGSRVEQLVVRNGRVGGVQLADGSTIAASRVVLAVGHSSRDVYRSLLQHDVSITPKPFAVGFRIEHPQGLIDSLQYGEDDATSKVLRGKGPFPVAEYRLAAEITADAAAQAAASAAAAASKRSGSSYFKEGWYQPLSLASDAGSGEDGVIDGAAAAVGSGSRGVYSFCMCPGGQIVPTSTNENELCINGMSFSRRDSKWANSALVVTVQPSDWQHLVPQHGLLAGMALQEGYEREAARRGGAAFVAPAQRASDFLAGRPSSGQLPPSSYRLGVKATSLHDFYPPHMTAAFVAALQRFNRQMPGFAGDQALLHAAETRTSAPIRIDRHPTSLESVSLPGLYPCGEGAGYAGGIVSSAVDGLRVGATIAAELTGRDLTIASNAFKGVKATY